MPNRLLTLVLCLLVLMPQQPCACHWFGCHGSPASDSEGAQGDARTDCCERHNEPVPAEGRSGTTVAVAHTPHDCPCCQSHPDGNPSHCPHAATDAVADPPKPVAVGDASELPLPFLSFTIPSADRSALFDRSHSPPRAHPVPLYITFCSWRN